MNKRIFFLMIAFLTFIGILVIMHYIFKPECMDRVSALDSGWNVNYNGKEILDVEFSKLRNYINTTHKGDRIILSREINSLDDYYAPTVFFETRFSAFRIMFNDYLVEEKFFDLYEKGEFVGCDFCMIALPANVDNGILKIELLVSENNAYNYYEAPRIGEFSDTFLYMAFTNMFVFITAAFLVIFGLLFLAISICFRSTVPEINMQIFASISYIELGIWFLAQFKLLDLFIDTHNHQTEIEYISLYLVVPSMYMVMGCMQNYLKSKLFIFFSTCGSAISVIPIISHFLKIAHINVFLPLIQLNAIIFFWYMMVKLLKDSKNGILTTYQIIQLSGQLSLYLSFIFNVIFYYLEVMGISRQIMLSKKAVPIGALMMVFASLINYYIYISESYGRHKENESLAHLAYADGLTNLPNRSRYEKYLADLSAEKKDFCVISIDLNGLKRINDSMGHLEGDKYLKEFSNILEKVFNGKGFVARIGGDEFVAILTDDNLYDAKALIGELERELSILNEKDPVIKRSVATGYAFKSEISETDIYAVYLLADERMYENKSKMHKELGIMPR